MLETLWQQLAATGWVQWLGMGTGITGIWLSIRERAAAWPFFLLCYTAYVYLSFRAGYFAFTGMNVVFIAISIYGWIAWTRAGRRTEAAPLRIGRLPPRGWVLVLAALALASLGIGRVLQVTGEASLPYVDAFAACSGFAAQFLLSRKYIENWFFWIVSDYLYLILMGGTGDLPSAILFGTFILLAFKGWLEWRQPRAGADPT